RRRQLVDVPLERAAVEQVAGNIVEPEALAQVVEHLRGFHRVTSAEHVIERPEVVASSRSPSRAGPASACSVQRQRQLPWARPGTFIRAPRPRLSTSCRGASVSAAMEDHARPISAATASRPSPPERFTQLQKFRRWSSGRSSYHSEAVALSGAPESTAVFAPYFLGRT